MRQITVFAFGDQGLAYVFSPGSTPTTFVGFINFTSTADLRGVTGTTQTVNGVSKILLWVVGSGGFIARFDEAAGRWLTLETSNSTAQLNAFAIVPGIFGVSEVIAVGNAGTILSRNRAGQWSEVLPKPTTNDLHGVFFASGKGVYVVGANGTILRRTSAGWTQQNSNVSVTLRGGVRRLGQATIQLLVVGDQGTLLMDETQ